MKAQLVTDGRRKRKKMMCFRVWKTSFHLKLSFPQATAETYTITATPTFLFFRNTVRVETYQGADAAGLEERVKRHTENDPGNSGDSDIPKGYVSGWQLYSLQMLPTLNTKFSTFIIWYYKSTWVLNGARANCAWLLYGLSWRQMLIKRCPAVLWCFSDGPHAFCQQSWLWVPEWERRLWLRELLKQRAVLPGVWLRWAGISCRAHLPPTSKSLLFSVIANANPEKSRHFNSVVQLLKEWMNGC